MSRTLILSGCLLWTTSWCGCGSGSTVPASAPSATADIASPSAPPVHADTMPDSPSLSARPSEPEIPSISFSSPSPPSAADGAIAAGSQQSEASRRELLAAMHPLQVMLGKWRGTTQKEVGDFKALDEPEWVWDFKTDRNQPAMVMTSAASPYFREVRLTYLADREVFQLTTKDPENQVRVYEGTFSDPPEEFQGDDQKTHVKYKLELTQVNAESPRDQWQVVFNQQENHRYLVELARKRGSNFLRFDTVATQRQGTSFARNDAEYGERECIISGGLGTIQVSYNGKSYWVCCTGCRAAFEEDPATWIAEYDKKKSQKSL